MVNGEEDGQEGGGDGAELPKREVAGVELAVLERPVDDVGDNPLEVVLGRGLEAPRGGLDRIGQHDQAGFLRLRRRSRVTVGLLAHGLLQGVVGLLGLGVEIADEGVAVVLFDHLPQGPGQLELAGELDAFLDVVLDDERAHRGRQVLVHVEFPGPVLDEVLGHLRLADVVVEGSGLGQLGIEAQLLGALLGQRGDDEGVVV